ncbi:MAG: DUF1800 domain-containing protein [Gammaproteobacteria bacterium]|nr:DUF1800 domain-containing protein [Gammaproteobacteria bacterium]
MSVAAYRASSHFGLGPRPGELEAIEALGADLWLARQLVGRPAPAALTDVPPSDVSLREMLAFQRDRNMMRQAGDMRVTSAGDYLRSTMLPQFEARLDAAIATLDGFRERLVAFWSNHFTVSTAGARTLIASSCVAFEHEAIRARLDGSFAAMLRAVVQHPVMLAYMDNLDSFAANSELGRARGRGVNENLAREVLELHTLGVGGGYDHRDVRGLAALLSGWSMGREGDDSGRFRFREQGHDTGTLRLLGRDYPQPGLARGEAALDDLARHPATARFLATKLAGHFAGEGADERVVKALEHSYLDSDGDLPSVHAVLIDLLLEGETSLRKLRTPNDFLVAALRGLDLAGEDLEQVIPAHRLETLAAMGQFPFQAPSPAGWPDSAEHWGAPTALLQRIDWAHGLAARLGSKVLPTALAAYMLPPQAEGSRRAVAAAESAAQGLTLLLAAPEFQWR